MGIALFLFVTGVLITGFFALTIATSERTEIAVIVPLAVALVLAVPVALLSLALIARIEDGRRG